MRLQQLIGEKNISISYIINDTPIPVLRYNTVFISIPELIINLETFNLIIIQFDPSFKKDSNKV